MTLVNSYLTQQERKMQQASSVSANNTTHNTARSGLVQRLVRAFASRDSRSHASQHSSTVVISPSMPGEVI